ncbi:hypothetical protein [Mucilaginibacter sp.]|uniref:hypothetical protein n=1 Tax=Mucilaginibacter sp. TaxID=1882438 RepID=UPI00262673A9|nr:hypothetical protein [Mucilaginibacter sp.]MDB4922257.1 hypothetical protein [Mucilaginibacter sp.]
MILNTAHQQIDHILGIFRKNQSVLSPDDLLKLVNESEIVVEPSVLNGIIEKLQRDIHIFKVGYAYAFQITFEGNLFIGYDKQRILEDDRIIKISQTETHLKSYKTRLLWATWSAGIFAGLLLLWQIFVYLYPHQSDWWYFWFQNTTK